VVDPHLGIPMFNTGNGRSGVEYDGAVALEVLVLDSATMASINASLTSAAVLALFGTRQEGTFSSSPWVIIFEAL